jgi:hypothetical protein
LSALFVLVARREMGKFKRDRKPGGREGLEHCEGRTSSALLILAAWGSEGGAGNSISTSDLATTFWAPVVSRVHCILVLKLLSLWLFAWHFPTWRGSPQAFN